MPSTFLLRSAAQHQSLFRVPLFLVSRHPMSYYTPSFLEVTMLHYNVFTKIVQSKQQLDLVG